MIHFHILIFYLYKKKLMNNIYYNDCLIKYKINLIIY
jgi:hypothetical protein